MFISKTRAKFFLTSIFLHILQSRNAHMLSNTKINKNYHLPSKDLLHHDETKIFFVLLKCLHIMYYYYVI